MPAKHRTFYTGRHMRNVRQCSTLLKLFNFFVSCFALNHFKENIFQMFGFINCFADNQIKHNIG